MLFLAGQHSAVNGQKQQGLTIKILVEKACED
jgi:hypothetical protein